MNDLCTVIYSITTVHNALINTCRTTITRSSNWIIATCCCTSNWLAVNISWLKTKSFINEKIVFSSRKIRQGENCESKKKNLAAAI